MTKFIVGLTRIEHIINDWITSDFFTMKND